MTCDDGVRRWRATMACDDGVRRWRATMARDDGVRWDVMARDDGVRWDVMARDDALCRGRDCMRGLFCGNTMRAARMSPRLSRDCSVRETCDLSRVCHVGFSRDAVSRFLFVGIP
jgi:hypothetical protein